MMRGALLALLAGASCACTFGAAPRTEKAAEVPRARVERGEFRVTVEEVGVLRSVDAQSVKAQDWGHVARLVDEGTHVVKGDPVIWLDTKEAEQWAVQLDAEIAEARSESQKQIERAAFQQRSQELDLRVSQAQLDFARRKLETAQKADDDASRQLEHGLISAEARERVGRELESADFEARKQDLEHQRKVEEIHSEAQQLQVERNQAEQTMHEHERRRADVQRQLDGATLRAPAAGEVFFTKQRFRGGKEERELRVGDDVGPWLGALAEIPDRTRMEVRSQVHEALAARVAEGTPVLITVKSLDGLQLAGKVQRQDVLAIPRSRSEGAGFSGQAKKALVAEEVVFPLTISLDHVDPRLQPGMTVGVSYVLDTLPDALSVPQQAVLSDGTRAMVLVAGAGGPVERKVRLGAESGGRVVVLEGLEAGEEIYLGDPRDSAPPRDSKPDAGA
jgi:multidrug resistance efflux pump